MCYWSWAQSRDREGKEREKEKRGVFIGHSRCHLFVVVLPQAASLIASFFSLLVDRYIDRLIDR